MGPMNIAGRRIVATATPTLNGSPVSWRTYHIAATSKMKSPDCDTSCPAQRSEKGRLERTRRKLGLTEIVWVRGEHDWDYHSLAVSLKSVPIGVSHSSSMTSVGPEWTAPHAGHSYHSKLHGSAFVHLCLRNSILPWQPPFGQSGGTVLRVRIRTPVRMGDLREGKNREISKDTRCRLLAIKIPAQPPSLDIKGKCLKSIFSFPDIIEIRHYRRMIQWIKSPTNGSYFGPLRKTRIIHPSRGQRT